MECRRPSKSPDKPHKNPPFQFLWNEITSLKSMIYELIVGLLLLLTERKIPENKNVKNTFSNGCLGYHNDEERSEMRYVMRNAKLVSHQNFERNLHFLRGVCLFECLFIPTPKVITVWRSRPLGRFITFPMSLDVKTKFSRLPLKILIETKKTEHSCLSPKPLS